MRGAERVEHAVEDGLGLGDGAPRLGVHGLGGCAMRLDGLGFRELDGLRLDGSGSIAAIGSGSTVAATGSGSGGGGSATAGTGAILAGSRLLPEQPCPEAAAPWLGGRQAQDRRIQGRLHDHGLLGEQLGLGLRLRFRFRFRFRFRSGSGIGSAADSGSGSAPAAPPPAARPSA